MVSISSSLIFLIVHLAFPPPAKFSMASVSNTMVAASDSAAFRM